jgi:DNA-binding HxlR family transcriptional regulator
MSTLVTLLHRRWAPAILAELHRTSGSRFVALAHRLGSSRESLRSTLHALVAAGLVRRNPGYGHPLRPEYLLTERGAELAPACTELVAALDRLDLRELGLRKWSLPAVLAIADAREARFSQLAHDLPGITPRALTLALKDLVAAGLVEREVTSDYPPATVYRLGRHVAPLVPILRRLAAS